MVNPKEHQARRFQHNGDDAMPGDMSWMKERYDDLSEKSLLWEPPTLESPNQPRCHMDGKPTIMLSANNYLNLTTHPKVKQAMLDATEKYGAGSGSVRAIAGTMEGRGQFQRSSDGRPPIHETSDKDGGQHPSLFLQWFRSHCHQIVRLHRVFQTTIHAGREALVQGQQVAH